MFNATVRYVRPAGENAVEVTVIPFKSAATINKANSSSSVLATTIKASAEAPSIIIVFLPERVYPFAVDFAVVAIAVGSK